MRMEAEDSGATTNRWTGWLVSLILGIVMGVAMLETGVIGVALSLIALGLISWKGPRLLGFAGFICGFAGTWALLFWIVVARCDPARLSAGNMCSAGVTAGYLIGSVIALVLGVGLTFAGLRRAGQRGG
jgi:hypothetical protein